MQELDPSNPQALQEAMTGGMFEPETTPEQQAALTRLETALALLEGWWTRWSTRLPPATCRRPLHCGERCAAGALRVDRLSRRSPRWWAGAAPAPDARGSGLVGSVAGRARHRRSGRRLGAPDLLPTSDDLDDPTAYAARDNELDLSALDELDPADTCRGGTSRGSTGRAVRPAAERAHRGPGDGPTEASRDDPRGDSPDDRPR